MSFEQVVIPLPGDTPGVSKELTFYRIGPTNPSVPKVYMQAALHADEQPGTMVLHHLLPLLRDADAAGRLKARFSVLPMVNPLGMANFSFARHIGRYDANTGLNYNRRWPNLFDATGDEIVDRLGDDAASNTATARRAISDWIERQEASTAAQDLRLHILREVHDADWVLDLHCDDDSLIHIFTSPEFGNQMQCLANWMEAAATLTAENSGGGSFDEMLPLFFRSLQAANPGKPVPMAAVTATLEYRGRADTFDGYGRDDARRLFNFLITQDLIAGETDSNPVRVPAPKPFDATEVIKSPAPGLLAYQVELGQSVQKGDVVAELIALSGLGAFLERTPIRAGTSGFVLSRTASKYVPRGANIAKIVGAEPLPGRSGYLLED